MVYKDEKLIRGGFEWLVSQNQIESQILKWYDTGKCKGAEMPQMWKEEGSDDVDINAYLWVDVMVRQQTGLGQDDTASFTDTAVSKMWRVLFREPAAVEERKG